MKLTIIQQKLTSNLKLNFCYMKTIHFLHSCYHPKLIYNILKNLPKTKCVCFNEWNYIIDYNKNEDENTTQIWRYNTNNTRPRHCYKYNKHKMHLLSMVMIMCIKQHLSNIWSWIYEKNEQHWDWVERKSCL